MAHKDNQLDQERFFCSICLDLLKVPVALLCGHSYCMDCIKSHWDTEDGKKIYSCPQCRETFYQRPLLRKNTMLADLVEELKKTTLEASGADHCYAGPEDVACDVCTGRKQETSYCGKHLQPHLNSPSSKKDKMVDPSKHLQENICPNHGEKMMVFCRTDQQCICHICILDQHKGHATVSAATERTQKQQKLELSQHHIQCRILDKENNATLLDREVKAVDDAANRAVKDSEKIFTELVSALKKGCCDVAQQIESQQKSEVSRVRELQEQLQKEIDELKRKDDQLKQLSHTQSDNQFLLACQSLSIDCSQSTNSPTFKAGPLSYFDDVTSAVSQVRWKVLNVLSEADADISTALAQVDVLLPQPEPNNRADFLKYSTKITMDPNTAHSNLLLTDDNRKVTVVAETQPYSFHPDRFTGWCQVLSGEKLTGRCYWELEWRGVVRIAVSYRSIEGEGNAPECPFGANKESWALGCDSTYSFYYNSTVPECLVPVSSSRVGVYLDHKAGVLSFFSITDTMTLIRRVQTKFTQPLYAGVGFYFSYGETVEFCELN